MGLVLARVSQDCLPLHKILLVLAEIDLFQDDKFPAKILQVWLQALAGFDRPF